MSELPPRPPRPGQAPGGGQGPEPKDPSKNEQKNEQKNEPKKKGFVRQVKPVIIMVLLITVAGLGYMAVRAGRDALTPPDPKAITLPAKMGFLDLQIPDGWKQARMGNVSKASARWAFGSPGARNYALFVSRYPLKEVPDGDQAEQQVLNEAQSSLAETGGPAKPRPLAEQEKISGQKAFRYAFRKSGMWIDIWLVIHSSNDRAALYQFSCQSPPSSKGQAMRESCSQVLRSVSFSDKAS